MNADWRNRYEVALEAAFQAGQFALQHFDQDIAVTHAGSDDRSWRSHVEEFQGIRAATAAFFRALPEDAWLRRGVASDKSFTVRALAYITAGHVAHHVRILRERYLPLLA